MERSEIFGEMQKIIAAHSWGNGTAVSQLTEETNFEAEGFDSLDTQELFIAAEEHFKINISDEEAEHVKTIGQLVSLIKKRV